MVQELPLGWIRQRDRRAVALLDHGRQQVPSQDTTITDRDSSLVKADRSKRDGFSRDCGLRTVRPHQSNGTRTGRKQLSFNPSIIESGPSFTLRSKPEMFSA